MVLTEEQLQIYQLQDRIEELEAELTDARENFNKESRFSVKLANDRLDARVENKRLRESFAHYIRNQGHFNDCNIFNEHLINPTCECAKKLDELLADKGE